MCVWCGEVRRVRAEKRTDRDRLNCITINGITINGITLNSITVNDVSVNSTSVNDININSITIQLYLLDDPKVSKKE